MGRPRRNPLAPVSNNQLRTAINTLGGSSAVARMFHLSNRAVRKWYEQGVLPRSEWTGETTYAVQLSDALGGAIAPVEIRGLEYPGAVVHWHGPDARPVKAA